MKRSDGLYTLSRRHFCTGLAGGIGLAVVGCGGSSGGMAGDAAGSGGSCATDSLDVGAPSTFQMNMPVYFAMGFVFVVRDANGLYALTARCPHQGFTTTIQSMHFFCPRHGSEFSFDGTVLTGPATMSLVHYAMCMLPNGNVGVLTSQTVAASDRLNV